MSQGHPPGDMRPSPKKAAQSRNPPLGASPRKDVSGRKTSSSILEVVTYYHESVNYF